MKLWNRLIRKPLGIKVKGEVEILILKTMVGLLSAYQHAGMSDA